MEPHRIEKRGADLSAQGNVEAGGAVGESRQETPLLPAATRCRSRKEHLIQRFLAQSTGQSCAETGHGKIVSFARLAGLCRRPYIFHNTLPSGDCRMKGKGPSERPAFIAYTLILAAGGILLAVAALRDTGDLLFSHLAPVASFALFIGIAWRFPFTILPRARMSMDYVFIIAALAVLPQPLPCMVGAVAALLGMLVRRGESLGARPSLALTCLNAGVLFITLATGALVASVLGAIWDFSQLTWQNTLGVMAMFLTLNLLNLALLSMAVHQRGGSALEFARHHL